MWKCELCNKEFSGDKMAIELRFGHLDEREVKEGEEPFDAFYTEEAMAPLCDNCAVAYIRGEKIDTSKF